MKKFIVLMLAVFFAMPAMSAMVDDVFITRADGYIVQLRPDLGAGTIAQHNINRDIVEPAVAVAIQSDGDVIYGTSGYGAYYRMNEDITSYEQVRGNVGAIGNIAVLSNDEVLVSSSAINGVVYKRTADTMASIKAIHSLGSSPQIYGLAVQSDDDVIIGLTDGRIYRRTATLGSGAYSTGNGIINDLAIQSDDNIILAKDQGYLTKIQADGLNVLANYNAGAAVKGVAVLGNDKVAYIQNDTVGIMSSSLTFELDVAGFGDLTAIGISSLDNIVVGNSVGEIWVLDQSLNTLAYGDSFGEITDLAVRVPEPASLVLISLGSLAVIRRKK